jgi:hypothetical protein
MDENWIVARVCAYFEDRGYVVTQRRHTTEHGIDIIAVDQRSGHTTYVEAKGGTSSRDGSARFGKPYTQTQVFDRVSKGVYTGLALRAEFSDRISSDVVLAFPDSKHFRRYLEPVRNQLADAGLHILLVNQKAEVSFLSAEAVVPK